MPKLANAYEFLYSLLAAGTSISTPAQPYIGFLPPPTQIALAASLIAYTFKTSSVENRRGPDAALRYLQCVLNTIEAPRYPYIRQAFVFPPERTRRRPRGHRNTTRSLSPEEENDIDQLYYYPEIWENETKEPKERANKKQKLGNVDFETGEVADYDSDEETKDAPRVTRAIERKLDVSLPLDLPDIANGNLNLQDAVERLGGKDAIALRQRLVALLAQVATKLPNNFTSLSDWFDNVVEDFRYLPTMLFNVFLTTLAVPGPMKFMFLANLLLPFVSGKLPDYFRYDPTQEHFESILLPLHGRQSFADNAKVSLILEQLFVLMMAGGGLKPTNELRKAMETGIQARHNVYGSGRGKRGNAGEEKQAKELMVASSGRLLGMLEILEIGVGKPSQKRAGYKASIILSFGSGSGSPLSSAPSDTEED
ncbi:hypothetical protein N0V95_004630 [Ascochyta clinopodiicola]|nr:hypothetical protein N0V95_004630 [Ascochyta clinopodiicola]